MTVELRRKLNALREVAPRLNAETDEATKVVQSVEAFLDGLNLGVPADVKFRSETVALGEDGDKSQTDVEWYLAYGRVQGKYRIHVAEKMSRTDNRDDYGSAWVETIAGQTAWVSCTRENKLASFAVLPDLLSEIADEANRLTSKAAEASKTVKELLASLAEEDNDSAK